MFPRCLFGKWPRPEPEALKSRQWLNVTKDIWGGGGGRQKRQPSDNAEAHKSNSEGPSGQSAGWKCCKSPLSLQLDPLRRFKFLEGKRKSSYPSTQTTYTSARQPDQQQHHVVHICLGDVYFSFWLKRKRVSQITGHFTRLTEHLCGN